MSADVYERLAQKLDALPNGYPRTESGVELRILEKIFNARTDRREAGARS
jgi:hypothetical protein